MRTEYQFICSSLAVETLAHHRQVILLIFRFKLQYWCGFKQVVNNRLYEREQIQKICNVLLRFWHALFGITRQIKNSSSSRQQHIGQGTHLNFEFLATVLTHT